MIEQQFDSVPLLSVSYSFFFHSKISLDEERLESLYSINYGTCLIMTGVLLKFTFLYPTKIFGFKYGETIRAARLNMTS